LVFSLKCGSRSGINYSGSETLIDPYHNIPDPEHWFLLRQRTIPEFFLGRDLFQVGRELLEMDLAEGGLVESQVILRVVEEVQPPSRYFSHLGQPPSRYFSHLGQPPSRYFSHLGQPPARYFSHLGQPPSRL
jgi:hypothetical protein